MNLFPLRRWGFQTLLRVSAIAGLTSLPLTGWA